MNIYLGDIFLLATDKILSVVMRPRVDARGVVAGRSSNNYQVPKTRLVVRY